MLYIMQSWAHMLIWICTHILRDSIYVLLWTSTLVYVCVSMIISVHSNSCINIIYHIWVFGHVCLQKMMHLHICVISCLYMSVAANLYSYVFACVWYITTWLSSCIVCIFNFIDLCIIYSFLCLYIHTLLHLHNHTLWIIYLCIYVSVLVVMEHLSMPDARTDGGCSHHHILDAWACYVVVTSMGKHTKTKHTNIAMLSNSGK